MMAQERGREGPVTDACVSDLVLDEIIAGARSRADHDPHFETCPRCSERLTLLTEHQRAVGDQIEMLVARAAATPATPPARHRRPWRWLAAATTVACALGAVWVGVMPDGDRDVAGDRAKGTAIAFYVQRGGEVTPGVSGARYRTGDALRFTISTGTTGFFLLVGIDQLGEVSAYHPFAGERSAPQRAGVGIPLPGSLVLDDSTDAEFFLGIFSRDPIEVSSVRAAVAQLRESLGPNETLTLSVLDDRLALPGSRQWVVIEREQGRKP